MGSLRTPAATQQAAKPLEPTDQVGQEAQRRAIAPVQVIHAQQQRLLSRDVEGEPVETMQHGEGDVQSVATRLDDLLEHRAMRPKEPSCPAHGAFALIGTLAGIRLLGLRRQRTAVSAVNDGKAHAVPEPEPA